MCVRVWQAEGMEHSTTLIYSFPRLQGCVWVHCSSPGSVKGLAAGCPSSAHAERDRGGPCGQWWAESTPLGLCVWVWGRGQAAAARRRTGVQEGQGGVCREGPFVMEVEPSVMGVGPSVMGVGPSVMSEGLSMMRLGHLCLIFLSCRFTPLHYAVQYEQYSAVCVLAASPSPTHTADQNGRTPLTWAAAAGSLVIMQVCTQSHAHRAQSCDYQC